MSDGGRGRGHPNQSPFIPLHCVTFPHHPGCSQQPLHFCAHWKAGGFPNLVRDWSPCAPQPLTPQLCALLILALKNVNALCTVILATVQCFPCVCVPYACEAVTSCPESEFRILAARTVSSLLYKPLVPACVLFSRENLSFFKEQKTGVQRWFFHVGPRLPYFFFFGFPSFL